MKVLITGITGFVGAGLAHYLHQQDNVEIHGIVRSSSHLWRLTDIAEGITLHETDLLNEKAISDIVTAIQPDVIFHLAVYGAYSYQKDQSLILATTTQATLNLLNAAKKAGVQMFVNIGSSSEYGTKNHPMHEDERIDPNTYYSIGKATQTHLCQYFSAHEGVPTVTFRLFSVYGPYEEPGRLVPTVIGQALHNETVSIADPDIARDFIYLDDVSQALFDAAKDPNVAGNIFNLGTGTQHTIGDMAHVILSECSSTLPFVTGGYEKRSFDTYTWVADMSKFEENIGWKPSTSLTDGIHKTVAWYKQHEHFYKAN